MDFAPVSVLAIHIWGVWQFLALVTLLLLCACLYFGIREMLNEAAKWRAAFDTTDKALRQLRQLNGDMKATNLHEHAEHDAENARHDVAA